MSENCDVIVSFQIFGQFGAVPRPDSGHRVSKSYVFSNSNLMSIKTENRTKKNSNTALTLFFEERYFFGQKTLIFCKKLLTLANLRGPRD